MPDSTKLAGTSLCSCSASLTAVSRASSSLNHAFVTLLTAPFAARADEGDNGRASAQFVQAPRPGRPDAADRNAQLCTDVRVGDRRVAHKQRKQRPASLAEAGERLAQR